ncbi:hypothetical protein BZG36_00096 [Bifiguratus adelaidae]|uniref:beta-N-acetylhexosaminidase n=1 Tax=Bifiguratus adelaidae TaxID=1938954 RepID=A0A261Y8Y9_9FUNG|nr:hypothetical protein BZG36_00096 [Bifiguratus adelaidae]
MASTVNIIPAPSYLVEDGIQVTIPDSVSVAFSPGNKANAHLVQQLLVPFVTVSLGPVEDNATPDFCIKLTSSSDTAASDRAYVDGSYKLQVKGTEIDIEAPNPTGIFYGIQTLIQLLPIKAQTYPWAPVAMPTSKEPLTLPCLFIDDVPRFAHRGHMLDDGRYFHGVEEVKRTLDLMAMMKLNVFHWHLTEDQGWRIEVPSYPKLTSISSMRSGSMVPGWLGRHIMSNVPHGGFYTQSQMREIVQYAAERHIMVVPEIDMPGHSVAVLAAYPELGCTGRRMEVATTWGVFKDTYCPSNPLVYDFLKTVLVETADIFPAPYFHIGGDEAPHDRWEVCPRCQELRQSDPEHIPNARALQHYFTRQMTTFLKEKLGKAIVGWNEMIYDELEPSAVIQYWWLGRDETAQHLLKHPDRKVILSDFQTYYIDHSHYFTSLADIYNFEPNHLFPELDAEALERQIIGVEAPMWSEWVPSRPRLDFQRFPRLCAMAESAWSPQKLKNYRDFSKRLYASHGFLDRLNHLGVGYALRGDMKKPWLRLLGEWLGLPVILRWLGYGGYWRLSDILLALADMQGVGRKLL